MNTYVYRCNNCSYEYEIEQRITEKSISLCPSCHQETCERLICAPIVIDMGAKTLGGQADKNTAKMGKYELEEKRYQKTERGKLAKKTVLDEIGGTKPKKEDKKPWYKSNDITNKQIQKMTPKQQQKYIMEGKK